MDYKSEKAIIADPVKFLDRLNEAELNDIQRLLNAPKHTIPNKQAFFTPLLYEVGTDNQALIMKPAVLEAIQHHIDRYMADARTQERFVQERFIRGIINLQGSASEQSIENRFRKTFPEAPEGRYDELVDNSYCLHCHLYSFGSDYLATPLFTRNDIFALIEDMEEAGVKRRKKFNLPEIMRAGDIYCPLPSGDHVDHLIGLMLEFNYPYESACQKVSKFWVMMNNGASLSKILEKVFTPDMLLVINHTPRISMITKFYNNVPIWEYLGYSIEEYSRGDIVHDYAKARLSPNFQEDTSSNIGADYVNI